MVADFVKQLRALPIWALLILILSAPSADAVTVLPDIDQSGNVVIHGNVTVQGASIVPGNCVQAGTGGLLTTTASACSTGSASVTADETTIHSTGGATPVLSFHNPVTAAPEIDFTGTTVGATKVAIGGDAGATAGLLLNVPTGSTNGLQFTVNGVQKAQITNAGAVISQSFYQGIRSGGATLTTIPTLYTSAAGATATNTAHAVIGSVSMPKSSISTVTLSGDAAFASGASYQTFASCDTGVSTVVTAPTVKQTDGTHFDLTNNNASTCTVRWLAIGT